MNVVDVVLAVSMIVFAVVGWRRGFLYGLLSLVGFLLGAAFGLWLAPRVVGRWDPGIGTAIVALVVVFMSAILGQVLVGLGGKRLRERVTWKPAVKLDAAAGSVLAVLSLLLVAWFAADLFVFSNKSSLARDVRQSQVLGFVDELMPDAADSATSELKSLWNESGFPDVFAGFGPEPMTPVGEPNARILRRDAVQRAAGETVKIVGPASCDRQLEGSGFAFAPERVLTNAHVVAGVDRPVLFVGGTGDGYPGRVVYFDPDLDLAVLAVPELPASALPFEMDVSRGSDVAVIGYPEDGPLTGVAGRVRSEQLASGHDIYGAGTVVREILSLRADIRPGNSGGPVLDSRGRVVGVVFASSLDHEDTGYAMTAKQVAPAVSSGVAASEPVDTGRCT
jgi:S1-C subfamily serine protease